MPKEKGLAHIPLIVLLIVALGVTIITVNSPTKTDVKGTIAKDDSSGSGSSGGSESSEDKLDSNGSSGSGSSGSTSTKITTPEGVKVETKTTDQKEKTEVRFSETERIKTETRTDRTKIEVRSSGVKIKYVLRDGKLVIKAENEQGEEEELEDEDEAEIEQELEDEGIKLSSASGKLVVAKGGVGALTNFPLRLDLATRQLIASTSAGTRVLTVLPDVAVQNMIRAHILSGLGPKFIRLATGSASPSGQLSQVNEGVELTIKNNKLVYKIEGIKNFNLLGFIPVTQPVTVDVSAEDGQLVETQTSLFTRIIDLLSP